MAEIHLDHKHLIVNATVTNPLVDPEATKEFLRFLVASIGMKIKIGPFADYCEAEGNNGITAAVCIETSHLSIHVWDKESPPYLKLDVYSCAQFDEQKVVQIIKDTFQATELDYMLLDRNKRTSVIATGFWKLPELE